MQSRHIKQKARQNSPKPGERRITFTKAKVRQEHMPLSIGIARHSKTNNHKGNRIARWHGQSLLRSLTLLVNTDGSKDKPYDSRRAHPTEVIHLTNKICIYIYIYTYSYVLMNLSTFLAWSTCFPQTPLLLPIHHLFCHRIPFGRLLRTRGNTTNHNQSSRTNSLIG